LNSIEPYYTIITLFSPLQTKMNFIKVIYLVIKEYVEPILIVAAVVLVVRTFLIQPFLVSGASMEPNFSDGNYLIINELSYRLREPKRGEVIVFQSPSDGRTYFIKRIIALPGEEINIKSGEVRINGKVIEEPYLSDNVYTRSEVSVTLGDEQYFVMGDNRGESYDSRSWGPLDKSKSKIVGVATLRLWPINEVKAIAVPEFQLAN